MTERCGTPTYIAPEILKGVEYDGKKADIWSAGVMLYSLLYGNVPFNGNDLTELTESILNSKIVFGDEISEEGQSILSKMLKREPEKRLSAGQLLQHKWFRDYDYTSIFNKLIYLVLKKKRNWKVISN